MTIDQATNATKNELLAAIAEQKIAPADMGFASKREMTRCKVSLLRQAYINHLQSMIINTKADKKSEVDVLLQDGELLFASEHIINDFEEGNITKSAAIREMLDLDVPRPIIAKLLNAHPSFVSNVKNNAYQRNIVKLTVSGIDIKLTYLGDQDQRLEAHLSAMVTDFMDEAYPSMQNPTRKSLREAIAELVFPDGVKHIHVGSMKNEAANDD